MHNRSKRKQASSTLAALRQREAELRRVNRALRTLSSCNQVLIHATSEPELLAEICRVMVHEGGYRLVWVGYAENDERKTVRPMASAGYEAGYLEQIGITWADEPRGRGPVGTAIRTGQPALCRDMLADPAFAPWREDAGKHGYASLMVLPLRQQETVFGALSIYAAEPDAFDAQEENLLKELADDLAFGIETLRVRLAREQAVEALRLSEKSLREAQRVACMGTWDLDLERNALRWSDEIYRIFELDPQEFRASYEAFLNAIHPEDRDFVNQAYTDSVRDRVPYDIVHRLRMPDGRIKYVNERCETFYDSTGRPLRSLGTVQDITERMQSEAQRAQLAAIIDSASDAIVSKGLDGIILTWNPAAERLFGYRAPEIVGRHVDLLIPEDRKPEETEILARIRRGELLQHYESVRLRNDGTAIAVSLTLSPIRDASGRVVAASTIVRDITEREKAQQALLAAGAYNRSLIEASLDPLVTIGLDGKIMDVNTATEAVTGRSRPELIGTDFSEYFTEPERARAGYQQVFRDGLVRDYPLELRHRDGHCISVLYNASVYRDGRGNVIGVFAAARDITERKQAEAAVRESEERFRNLTENTSDWIWEINERGVYTYASPRIRDLLGYAPEEVLGRTPFELMPAEERVRLEPEFAARVAARAPIVALENINRHKDGRRVVLETSAVPVFDARGLWRGYRGIDRDVTERQRAAEELQWRNVLLSTVQEASIDGILVVDENARIISYNRRFIEMWHIPDQPVQNRDDEAILRHVTTQLVDQPSFLERVRHLYAHRAETSRDELKLTDSRVIDRYSAPMFGLQGRYYGRVWYFRDITDRRKLEAQFIQAQKLEAVGQLAGGVAHDFNNILGVILMQLNLLQMESGLSGTVVSGLAELERHAMRGAGLTRQLLMFSRRREMELRVFDLNVLLEDVSKMLRRLLGEDIAFELKRTATPLAIEADAGMVEQVMMNLCINARDAMRHGGQLTIEVLREERPPPAGGPAGSYACLAVTDTGCGMDEATKARIFEPFFTTKPVGKGTGLGLATVYGIVQQHHGWIEVDTAPNCGSTFRVFFPSRERPPAAEEAAALREIAGGHESILLVEDEEALRTSMTACLQNAGYRVTAAANGVEALAKWEEGRHEFALLLTDYLMPERMTGVELATQLARAKSNLKVIIMSGYTPGAKETDVPWPTGITRLAKPFEVRKLLQTVRHGLDAK